jgi:O-acetyl-ADP-ribose deacetylase (regulator of RNase III)
MNQPFSSLQLPDGEIRLLQGDITHVAADVICNAANSGLRGGGGVDGAIHRAGGPSLMKELDVIRQRNGGCPTGSAVATHAGRLAATWVFHAVGPIYQSAHNSGPLLASAYEACMRLGTEKQITSIAFPSLSTGVYGYPLDEAAPIALETIRSCLPSCSISLVTFVLFDRRSFKAYNNHLR